MQDAKLFDKELIQGELDSKKFGLVFNHQLEQQYLSSHFAKRKQDFLIYGVLALLVYDLFLINDFLNRPEVFNDAVFWRFLATLFGLSAIWAVRKIRSPIVAEHLISSSVVVVTFCSCQIVWATENQLATYDPFVFSLIIFAANCLLPLRFTDAVWVTIINISMSTFYVVNHHFIDHGAIDFILALLVSVGIFSLATCYRIESSYREIYLYRLLEKARSTDALMTAESFKQLSLKDTLTGLANRRAFNEKIEALYSLNVEETKRSLALSIILIDIDRFKQFNDSQGHQAGDLCITRVANAIRQQVRATDFIGRYGGEEFVVLLRTSNKSLVEETCERLRQSVLDENIEYSFNNQAHRVSISLGAAISSSNSFVSIEQLINNADKCLYQAKENGRNNWVINS